MQIWNQIRNKIYVKKLLYKNDLKNKAKLVPKT